MKKIMIGSLLLVGIASGATFAAPKIIIKNWRKHTTFQTAQLPSVFQQVIQKIATPQDKFYEIVINEFSDHYSMYLLSNENWGVKKYSLDLNGNLISDQEDPLDNEDKPICPDTSIQFLVISAYPGMGSVDESIDLVSKAASQKYKTMTILSGEATGKIYKNWLACPNLKGVYSIGHGSNSGIMVGNGDFIDYSYFATQAYNDNYKNTTIFINACQVFNYPFGSEFVFGNKMFESQYEESPGPHVKQFVGGITNLLMNYSELSSACLMAAAINGAPVSYKTLRDCIGEMDIHYQDFGIAYPGRSL